MIMSFCIAAILLFVVLSIVLARDDGPFGLAIRLGEILLPLAAAMALSGLFLKGAGPSYFPAATCFGFATAIALLRRLPSVWTLRPPEGARVFVYSAAILAGLSLTVMTVLNIDLIRR